MFPRLQAKRPLSKAAEAFLRQYGITGFACDAIERALALTVGIPDAVIASGFSFLEPDFSRLEITYSKSSTEDTEKLMQFFRTHDETTKLVESKPDSYTVNLSCDAFLKNIFPLITNVFEEQIAPNTELMNAYKKQSVDYYDDYVKKLPFHRIYQFAKEFNREALSALIASGQELHVFFDAMTPIMQLAKEGEHEAVDFLLSEFDLSKTQAARGYAIGGNTTKVNQLLQQGASIHEAVFGYMFGGHIAEAEKLIDRGASLDRALHGYSMRGEVEKVADLIAQGAQEHQQYSGYARGGHHTRVSNSLSLECIPAVIFGYAMRCDTKKVEEWLTKLKKSGYQRYYQQGLDEAIRAFAVQGITGSLIDDLLSQGASLKNLIYGYAESGCAKEINARLDKIKSSDAALYQACLDEALYIYAYTGNVKQVVALSSQNASVHQAIEGYAYGGHVDLVNKMLEAHPDIEYRNSAARGYAKGEYFNFIEQIILRDADPVCALPRSLSCHDQNYMLRALAFINDDHCRELLFDAAKSHELQFFSFMPFLYPTIEESYSKVKPILEKAKRLNAMMQVTGCHYKEALQRDVVIIQRQTALLSADDEGEENVQSSLVANSLFAGHASTVSLESNHLSDDSLNKAGVAAQPGY